MGAEWQADVAEAEDVALMSFAIFSTVSSSESSAGFWGLFN